MKKLYIALSFVISTAGLQAQNSDTAKADKLYERYEFVSAAEQYSKLVDQGKADGYVYKQLADTYFNMFNTAEAAKWYAKAVETDQDAETYYRYAQMLKGNGQYEESNKQMRKFASASPNDQRAKTFMENPNYIPKLMGKEKMYDIMSLSVSSEHSDFGPLLNNNTLYFTSARNTSRKTYGWNDEPFLDIYTATYNTDGTINEATALTDLNSQYHDGPLTLSADGNTMYFTSDSFRESSFVRDRKNKLKLGKNNLFKATKTGEKWGNVLSLPFNSTEYSTSNPSLSHDGKTLYFSSDMPGSLGGVDIWKVAVNADGTYGAPENLGKRVNTEGNESFPFIAQDNQTLYFASAGKPGLGGYDVFKVKLNDSSEAVNLGKPVNSEKDDFSFSYDQEKNTGFFASNRSGMDNIYGANPLCGLEVLTVVTDSKTGKILSNAKVSILDDKNNVIATEMSNSKGEVGYNVECNKAFTIQVSATGYESNTFAVAPVKTGTTTNVAAMLNPIAEIIKENEVVLNAIYFEFDKSNITREGAYELDKLVEAMKANPTMVIMVKAHTDNRGSDVYNMRLSDRRAKSSVQYILSKGIKKDRISGKGYGESELKVDCGEGCTEAQHAENRRSEFIIVKK